LETKFLRDDCKAMPTPYPARQRSGVRVTQLGELLRPRHGDRFSPDDLTVKNTRLSLQIGNDTRHGFLRSMGHVPLQQAREDGKCEGVRA